ncbi:MAG: ankyrin repeat domain-containing protein [Pseudomonadota bacterium]
MSAPNDTPPRALPDRPSPEHLRKQAKRLARAGSLGLAEAQRRLAADYGSRDWAELMRRVAAARGDGTLSPLAAAAKAADAAAARRLLAEGHAPDGPSAGDVGTPLWQVCASGAPDDARLEVAMLLLEAGANPRRDSGGETALHAAAVRGPLALVELLIRRGALEWQPDRKGRSPLAAARRSKAADKAAIVEMLHRPVVRDPAFRAAVTALQCGDTDRLARLLDAEPRLLRERIVEPDCYRDSGRPQYFGDPKLFWFIANNPTLVQRLPDNIVAVAEVMITRGVERDDLDYALELVMTSTSARTQNLQVPLIERLIAAGAAPTPHAIDVALAHRELGPMQALLRAGHPMTAPIAAALGDNERLASLLRTATPSDLQRSFGLAVINGQTEAVRLALDAGADVDAFLPVHSHSTALHQAALDENLALLDLLIERGARADIADTLWHSTPLGWAIHQGKARSQARLEALAAG